MEGSTTDSMCRCCAAEGIFKDIKTSYHWMGEEEVYGDMLRECFDVKLATIEEGGICEVCITQLRNAANFKKQVLHTEKKFKRHLETRRFKPAEVKEEDGNSSDDMDRDDDSEEDEDYVPDFEMPIKTEVDESKTRKRGAKATTSRAKKSKTDSDDKSIVFSDYKSIKKEVIESENSEVEPKVEEFCVIEVKPVRKSRKTKISKKESSIRRTKLKAIPIYAATIKGIKIKPPSEPRLPSHSVKIEPALDSPPEQMEIEKQRHNIRTILLNSNATPIRKHYVGSGYNCCFCKASFPIPADLKAHTINEHDNQTKNKFMKNIRMYSYIVKLDITSLSCNICNKALDTIDQLVDHLNNIHQKGIHTDVKSYYACFIFNGEETKCHICSAGFRSFKLLQEHMNKHCMNFICDECGVGCINRGQLKLHSAVHESGAYRCSTCEKVFKSLANLQSHTRQTHSAIPVNKCHLCEGRFKSNRNKRNHLIEAHGMVFPELECDACNRTFKTGNSLSVHKKKDHLMERRYKCEICYRTFFTSHMLKEHEITHTGVRNYKCEICSKTYSRRHGLREHMRSHTGDRRFKCSYCGMAFLQKCSLKGHLRSRHDAELQ